MLNCLTLKSTCATIDLLSGKTFKTVDTQVCLHSTVVVLQVIVRSFEFLGLMVQEMLLQDEIFRLRTSKQSCICEYLM